MAQVPCKSSEIPIAQTVIPTILVPEVLHQLHTNSGHLGLTRTLEKVKKRAYWPGYEDDNAKFVHECQHCQRRNQRQPQGRAPLGTITADAPFQKLAWDIMGPLPTTPHGSKYLLVVTDVFTKWVEAFPLKSTEAESLATVLVKEVICRFGVPEMLHSDQGANLCSQVVQRVCDILGMHRTRTSAYHPQGNGQVERFNRTVESMLAKVVQENQKDWDTHIPSVLLAYRSAIHESTGFTPFHLTFGRSPRLPVDLMLGRTLPDTSCPEFVQDLHRTLRSSFSLARCRLRAAHLRAKTQYDQQRHHTPFHIGDRVWLFVPAVKPGRKKNLPHCGVARIPSWTRSPQSLTASSSLAVITN